MSQFIGAADPSLGYIAADDTRLRLSSRAITRTYNRLNAFRDQGYANLHWPGNRGFVGDYATDIGIQQATSWAPETERVAQGIASRLGFYGTARDAYGAPLANVTCSLFHVSDRAWIQDFTSRSDGTFSLYSWYADQHFIVFYKSGPPDVFGTTKQNLTGV